MVRQPGTVVILTGDFRKVLETIVKYGLRSDMSDTVSSRHLCPLDELLTMPAGNKILYSLVLTSFEIFDTVHVFHIH